MTVSKGKQLMAFRNFCGRCEQILFTLWYAQC